MSGQRFCNGRGVLTATLIGVCVALLPGRVPAQEPPGLPEQLGDAGFLENVGQWPESIRYGWSAGDHSASMGSRGDLKLYVSRRFGTNSALVRVADLEIQGLAPLEIEGKDRLASRYSFLKGPRAAWRLGVRAYDSVWQIEGDSAPRLRSLSAGSDSLVLSMSIPPGSSLPSLRFGSLRGQPSESNGRLMLDTETGTIMARLLEPASGQDAGHPPSTHWVVRDPGTIGFDDPDWDGTSELTLTMGLEWSTYLGGSLNEIVAQAVIADDGTILIGGNTTSFDFPTTTGAYDETYGDVGSPNGDIFLSRLDAAGTTLLSSTFLGGVSADVLQALHVASNGEITMAGTTWSADFPTTAGAFDTMYTPDSEGFVTRMPATIDDLIWSTFLGGAQSRNLDEVLGAAVDPAGVVTVVGSTTSPDFPTTPGAYDPGPASPNQDAFISRFSSDGSTLVFSTLLAGSMSDYARGGIALLPDGGVVVGGSSLSPDFPTTPGAYAMTGAPSGRFVSIVDSTGSQLLASTFVPQTTWLRDVKVTSTGTILVVGGTQKPGFPVTPGALQTVYAGLEDGYLMEFDQTLSTLLYSTLLGFGNTQIYHMSVDSADRITLVGVNDFGGFPTTSGAVSEMSAGGKDVVVARLNAEKSKILYSTYLGGPGTDGSEGYNQFVNVAVDWDGSAVVVGTSESPSFPLTSGAIDETFVGNAEGFVARLSMLPAGTGSFGDSTPGSQGKLGIGVTATPTVGNPDFGLTCTQAPPLTSGLLVLGSAGLDTSVPAKGTQMWVSPYLPYLLVPVVSNDLGYTELPTPIPNDPTLATLTVYTQFFFKVAASGPSGWAASNALAITLQP